MLFCSEPWYSGMVPFICDMWTVALYRTVTEHL